MREILFKGKTHEGEWVQGDLYHRNEEVLINNFHEGFNLGVIPETVGQYTGLTDKNGNKIFEGDIVKIYLYEPKGLANYEIGCIRFDDTKARFIFCTNDGKYSFDNTNPFEVIGNIHDNPELLESEADE